MLIVIPVYDDWEALSLLISRLDAALASAGRRADLLVIDDASPTEPPETGLGEGARAIGVVDVLRLRRNVGHQGAIAIGLAFVEVSTTANPIVVMDADGEDRPEDVLRLVERCEQAAGRRIVLAKRAIRSEGAVFRAGYKVFRGAFRILTGRTISTGNFSVIPRALLPRVTGVSEVWNHYSCGLMKARLPLDLLPCDRGNRLAGKSRMNLLGLVEHGLSAMAVYSEKIGVRALAAAGMLGIISVLCLTAAVIVRLTTTLAIPGWATYVVGLSMIMLLQALSLGIVFVFLVLYNKNGTRFLPARDYVHFVLEVIRIRE